MSKKQTLKAGALIESLEDEDSDKLPSRNQLLKLETNIEKLPTIEVLRRVYKRHSTGIWQLTTAITWTMVIFSWLT